MLYLHFILNGSISTHLKTPLTMNLIKQILLASTVTIYSGSALSTNIKNPVQNSIAIKLAQNKLIDNPILFENESVIFEINFVEVKTPNSSTIKVYGIIQVTNKTTESLKVEFVKDAYYDGKCNSCGYNENRTSLVISPQSYQIGTKENNSNGLRVFHSFKSGESKSQLTDLIISNLKIEKV